MTVTPSPELKALLAEFCRIQREKYGPDWKAVLAKEMADKTAPVVEGLLKGMRPDDK